MTDVAVVDYETFKRRIQKRTGLDLNSYKQGQMSRRLKSFMERAGVSNFQEYYRMLEKNEALMNEFLNRVTINVSELFRNPEQFEILETRVIPDLLRRASALQVWSAGCAYGQEPYSLAICLEEKAPRRPHALIATDIDDRALDHARKGIFAPMDVKNLSSARAARWFKPQEEGLVAGERLRRMIQFRKLDLLKDVFPRNLDLIACRNVVIYFNEEAKDSLYRRLYHALNPGGCLFVGGTERITGYSEIGYTNPYPFYYQKSVK